MHGEAASRALVSKGAGGDIDLRFFDEHGHFVPSPLDERVPGMGLAQLKGTRRVVAVAGGMGKFVAI